MLHLYKGNPALTKHLTWEEKCRLIQSDPVTCARHFDYQFNTFLKDFLMNDISPLGKIKDWFYRVEYQQWGSPQIHMLIWLENAPIFGVDKDVTAFIDQIITCRKPYNDSTLLELVNRQTHRHFHTCRKKSKNVCIILNLQWDLLRSSIHLMMILLRLWLEK